jgi:hypothetical protein
MKIIYKAPMPCKCLVVIDDVDEEGNLPEGWVKQGVGCACGRKWNLLIRHSAMEVTAG